LARADSFFTSSGGEAERGGGAGFSLPLVVIAAKCAVLGRLERGEEGERGGGCAAAAGGVGVMVVF